VSDDLKQFPLVNDWAKGCYVARVTGSHPKYVYDREFYNGTPVKSRGTLEYLPGRDLPGPDELPAWFVVRDRYKTDELIEVTELGYRVVGTGLTSVEVLDVHTAGAPGAPGAWTGSRCDVCDSLAFPGVDCTECSERAGIAAANAAAPAEVPW
jgi:hypothetical protein